MTTLRSLLPLSLAALAALSGCTPDFDPASEVQGLRVLAVRAEPPEVAPAEVGGAPAEAALETLVAHPDLAADPSRRFTVLHLACTPTPGDPSPSPCTTLAALEDPSDLIAALDPADACAAEPAGRTGAVTFAGLAACGRDGCAPVSVRLDPADAGSAVALPAPVYRLPPGLGFDAYPAGAPERVLGLEVVDVALALDVDPDALAPATAVGDACAALVAVVTAFEESWQARPHVAALKRIRVRGPEARNAPNRNPVLAGITAGGAPLPAPGGTPAALAARAQVALLPALPGSYDELRERYVEVDAAGAPVGTRDEEWTFSWFGTTGELDDLHTRAPGEEQRFTAPAIAGRALLWLVVRDLRGGVAWTAAEVEVAP